MAKSQADQPPTTHAKLRAILATDAEDLDGREKQVKLTISSLCEVLRERYEMELPHLCLDIIQDYALKPKFKELTSHMIGCDEHMVLSSEEMDINIHEVLPPLPGKAITTTDVFWVDNYERDSYTKYGIWKFHQSYGNYCAPFFSLSVQNISQNADLLDTFWARSIATSSDKNENHIFIRQRNNAPYATCVGVSKYADGMWSIPHAFSTADRTDTFSSEFETSENRVAAKMSRLESEMSQLLGVIKHHLVFMQTQEANVNKVIEGTGSNKSLLLNAKKAALSKEKEILDKVLDNYLLNQFLTDVVLVENLFNSVYSEGHRSQQKEARRTYAPNISRYESKKKPCCNISSFIDLLFTAKTSLNEFKEWLKNIQQECAQKNIKIVDASGAKEKNIERAFYKAFYVYSSIYGANGFKQMTDPLRCSLVFDNFKDLYQCFTVIEEAAKPIGGILRCKDRFDPKTIDFGYRDLLINIWCPAAGSSSNKTIVCEVQLHHKLFYQHKKISHEQYKKARLFEDKSGKNLAYQYAKRFVRPNIGNRIYGEHEQKSGKSGMDPEKLLKGWDLSQYFDNLVDEGYDKVTDWMDLTLEELVDELKFKKGHAKRFIKSVKGLNL